MAFLELKQEYLDALHKAVGAEAPSIASSAATHQKKAQAINSVIANAAEPLRAGAMALPAGSERQSALITLQYCLSVISLEYRHSVWPYEYMAFSRRIGELWERFCSACWDHPAKDHVQRIDEPKFSEISQKIRERIMDNSVGARGRGEIEVDLDNLLQLIGEINMKEDEVFEVDGVPHVVDFKSGFGSNEKGNMLRLMAVGRAYKLWNPDTELLLLVRQNNNNNYLNVLRRAGLWSVFCGDEAYEKIDQLTGSDMATIRPSIVDFDTDLSADFQSDIDAHLSNLKSYLEW